MADLSTVWPNDAAFENSGGGVASPGSGSDATFEDIMNMYGGGVPLSTSGVNSFYSSSADQPVYDQMHPLRRPDVASTATAPQSTGRGPIIPTLPLTSGLPSVPKEGRSAGQAVMYPYDIPTSSSNFIPPPALPPAFSKVPNTKGSSSSLLLPTQDNFLGYEDPMMFSSHAASVCPQNEMSYHPLSSPAPSVHPYAEELARQQARTRRIHQRRCDVKAAEEAERSKRAVKKEKELQRQKQKEREKEKSRAHRRRHHPTIEKTVDTHTSSSPKFPSSQIGRADPLSLPLSAQNEASKQYSPQQEQERDELGMCFRPVARNKHSGNASNTAAAWKNKVVDEESRNIMIDGQARYKQEAEDEVTGNGDETHDNELNDGEEVDDETNEENDQEDEQNDNEDEESEENEEVLEDQGNGENGAERVNKKFKSSGLTEKVGKQESSGSAYNQIIEVALYIISGILLIFVMEQFIQIGIRIGAAGIMQHIR